MKNIIAIILLTLLTACGDGAYCEPEQVVKQEKPVDVVNMPQPETVEAPKPVEPVAPICDLTTFIPCDNRPAPVALAPVTGTPPDGMELCDVTSYNPCQYPTWIPKRPESVL